MDQQEARALLDAERTEVQALLRDSKAAGWGDRAAKDETVTRTLSPAQAERYRPRFDNTKRLRELTTELETLSAEAIEQAKGRHYTRAHSGWTAGRESQVTGRSAMILIRAGLMELRGYTCH